MSAHFAHSASQTARKPQYSWNAIVEGEDVESISGMPASVPRRSSGRNDF